MVGSGGELAKGVGDGGDVLCCVRSNRSNKLESLVRSFALVISCDITG